MIDHVIRNARLAGHPDPMDIGFAAGRIAEVGRSLACDAPATDARGCLCCAGMVESHIHLAKSRIIGCCAPEQGRRAPHGGKQRAGAWGMLASMIST